MFSNKITTFVLAIILLSCDDHKPTQVNNNISDTPNQANGKTSDASNQDIYDFMKMVIADQKLDVSFGLSIEPEPNCDLSEDDETFLRTLLKEQSHPKKETDVQTNWTVKMNELPKCLSNDDFGYMLEQKRTSANFQWDNSKLGFSLTNEQNWYSFSVPLFSIDKNKAIMMIKRLCPGLCGSAWTVLFTFENDQWNSEMGSQWAF